MIAIANKLSPTETRLWALLRDERARRIAVLALAINRDAATLPQRKQQQYVAAHISHINKKLPKPWRIMPGGPRRTYQLRQVTER